MAAYATYRHVELDRIGLGKKRVNFPPGGGGRLSDTAKEPKTVRVLKPPGGESSISFGDNPEPARKASVTPKVEQEVAAPAPKASAESPVTDESPAPKEAPSTPEAPEPAVESSPIEEAVAVEKTNGTTSTNGSVTPPPSLESPCVDISVEKLSIEADAPNFPKPVDKIEIPESAKTNGNHVEQQPVMVPASPTPEIVIVQNGSSKPCLPPLKIDSSQSSLSDSPLSSGVVSPVATSPSLSNGDTKEHHFAANGGASSPQVEASNRKVKDRMRSNIFAPSNEEFTPTRSSRFNAQVVTPETTNGISNAGQRGRVPPGGFSSKLW